MNERFILIQGNTLEALMENLNEALINDIFARVLQIAIDGNIYFALVDLVGGVTIPTTVHHDDNEESLSVSNEPIFVNAA